MVLTGEAQLYKFIFQIMAHSAFLLQFISDNIVLKMIAVQSTVLQWPGNK